MPRHLTSDVHEWVSDNSTVPMVRYEMTLVIGPPRLRGGPVALVDKEAGVASFPRRS